jgi:long-chain acyl-CoA synthetase
MPQAARGTLAPWWDRRDALLRFICDLVATELTALRHELVLPDVKWRDELSLQHDLGVDSLELLHVAGVLADVLQVRRAGVEDYLLVRRTLGDWTDLAAMALKTWDEEITFRTSGSTGTPKPCTHAIAALEQEAQAIAALFSGRRRVLLAVPTHHIYGFLCGQLLPRHLHSPAPVLICIRDRLPSQLAHFAQPGDLVIGHPQFWQAALASGHAFVPDVVGVSSTAPCPQAVAALAEATGMAALFELYGSSETAGIGWRASWRDPFTLFAHLERDSATGDVVRGSAASHTALPLQDVLDWCGGRQFRVAARRDGAVQVGGINVFPERVRALLLSYPGIKDAAVRLMREDEGTRLKAFIVPAATPDDPRDFLGKLRHWADQALGAAERPKAFTLGTELPRGPMGKPADWNAGS